MFGLIQYSNIIYENEDIIIERCLRSDSFNVSNSQVLEELKRLQLLNNQKSKEFNKEKFRKYYKSIIGLNEFLAIAYSDDGEYYNPEYSDYLLTNRGEIILFKTYEAWGYGIHYIDDHLFKIEDAHGFDIYRCLLKKY